MAVSLRSSIAKRRSHLNAALKPRELWTLMNLQGCLEILKQWLAMALSIAKCSLMDNLFSRRKRKQKSEVFMNQYMHYRQPDE
ncbi:hypothetical protein CWO17_24495 [Vibrio sp. 10N.286.45.A3]|nr:hypothetical protein CWO17_24495 [Vibrio sp. 10N.286.45.A3]PTQ18616.1 hypothetical protein CWO24_23710 [Vibrio sp. 10N.286.46.E10]